MPRTGSDEKSKRDRLGLTRNEYDLKTVFKRNKFSFRHMVLQRGDIHFAERDLAVVKRLADDGRTQIGAFKRF